jgi:hypothetical protein
MRQPEAVQINFGFRPASYPLGNGTLSRVVKRPRREADHSPPTSVEGKKMWIYTSTPHKFSWCSALLFPLSIKLSKFKQTDRYSKVKYALCYKIIELRSPNLELFKTRKAAMPYFLLFF